MNLFFFMLVSAFLGLLLLAAGPTFGSFFAFMILAACLFRGLYLLNKINDKLTIISERNDSSLQAMARNEGIAKGEKLVRRTELDGQ